MSNLKALNATWSILGPCRHPADGRLGTAIKSDVTGVEAFWTGASVRSLPRNWRSWSEAAIRLTREHLQNQTRKEQDHDA